MGAVIQECNDVSRVHYGIPLGLSVSPWLNCKVGGGGGGDGWFFTSVLQQKANGAPNRVPGADPARALRAKKTNNGK